MLTPVVESPLLVAAVELDPLCEYAGVRASDLMLQSNEMENAVQLWKSATEKCPSAGWAWSRLAQHHKDAGEFGECILCLQRCLQLNLQDLQAWVCLS